MALRDYLKPPGVQVEYHQLYFNQDEQDDVWLSQVGQREWFVVGQDYKFHERPAELHALKTHNVGAFYLWGADAPKWETMRVFARAYDKIIDATLKTSRPFVYRVHKHGGLYEVALP